MEKAGWVGGEGFMDVDEMELVAGFGWEFTVLWDERIFGGGEGRGEG